MGGQPAWQQGPQGAVRLLEPHLEPPGVIGQAEPHVAVVEADPVVVAHHHHRAARIPVAVTLDQPCLGEGQFEPLVQPRHPEGAVPQGAEDLEVVERLEHRSRVLAGPGRLEVAAITGHPLGNQGVVSLPRPGVQADVAKSCAPDRLHRRPVAAVAGPRQLADARMLVKAPALGKQAEAVAYRCPGGRALQAIAGLAGEPIRLRRADALFDKAADIAEHGPRLHRGELILVAEQDEAGMAGQRVQQARHHGQVHHGGLVHHQQVEVQRVASVMAELAAPGDHPEQPVQGARLGGDGLYPLGGQIQGLQGSADTLGQTRRRLAGGGHQPDRRGLAPLQAGLHQDGEELGDRSGLAGAGAAGDDREGARRRRGRRQLLAVAAERLGHQGIQPLQLAGCLGAL